ncbi:hypothetical protein DH2020_009810 [Rehmannia glutinosa]|uniref:Histone-lysine N-methyltransferase n=1 Tax=Rehmannia glutinosa TaxID=99300 RepID=A0ABR0X9L4_REHGL
MPSLRKRTQAPEPVSGKLESRKRSRSKQEEEEEEDYSDVCCDKCGSGHRPAELLLCDKCDRGFHLFCLRPVLVAVPEGRWFCPSCSNHKNLTNCRKRRKRTGGLVMSKKKSRKLLPFIPSEDSVRRLEQMASLATALTATGAEFSNKLTYVTGMAPRSANYDAETLDLCKNMMERGEWPPLMVVFDPQEGWVFYVHFHSHCSNVLKMLVSGALIFFFLDGNRFTVEADRYIRDLTIITEYVGDVDYLKNRKNDDGDSMMTLLTAADPSKSLVICPDKRSNIARFINGINNHIPGGKKKQNVKCVRFNVNGECRVLLIANRDIRKGERLYYDYNGYENEYPTEHFV